MARANQRASLAHAWRRVRALPVITPRNPYQQNVRWLYLNTAVVGVPIGGIMAFLSVFLARLGASSTLIGWLTSGPSLLAAIAFLPAAAISERFSDQVKLRVWMARVSLVAFLICALLPFVVPEGAASLLALLMVVVWTLKALPDAVSVPTWMSVLTRAIPPKRRAQLNGRRWALLSAVSAISSALFGWLLDGIAFPLNYQVVFLISFAVGWLDPAFFSRIIVPPLDVAPPEPSATRKPALRRVAAYLNPIVHEKTFLVFLLATVAYRIVLNMPASLLSLFWVNDLQATDAMIGLRGTVGHCALVVGYLAWGRLAGRMGHRRVLVLSALLHSLFPIITALSPSAFWLLPAAAVWGLAAAGINVGLFDLTLACCPTQRQQRFIAVDSMIANLAVFAGPLLGVAIADAESSSLALLVSGGLQVVTIVPFLLLPREG